MDTSLRFCIGCGRDFDPAGTDRVLCDGCGGPATTAPVPTGQSTRLLEERPQPTAQALSEVPLDWAPGTTILGLYEAGPVFAGGMGRVQRVHHLGWDIDLAVKTPTPELLARSDGAATVVGEAEAWIALGLHPNVVSCYYVRTLGPAPRIFAEWVDGGTLDTALRTRRLYVGADPLAHVLDLAVQLVWGLGHAHRTHLLHRDLKPANVMLTGAGQVKLTDFGLTRAIATGRGREPDPARAGLYTPAFASPEQLEGAEELTLASDVYSYAVTVLAALLGGCDWEVSVTARRRLRELISEGRRSPAGALPGELTDLLQRCLERVPQARPDLQEIAATLLAAYERHTGTPYPHPEPEAGVLLAPTLNNQALSQLDLGRPDTALETLQEALAVDPNHPEARYNLEMLRWERGEQADDDVVSTLRSVANATSRWEAWLLLARAEQRRREAAGAAAAIEEAERAGAPANDLERARSAPGPAAGIDERRHRAAGTVAATQVVIADAQTLLAVERDGQTHVWPTTRATTTSIDRVPARLLTASRPSQLPTGAPVYVASVHRFVVPRTDGSYLVWEPRTGRSSAVQVFGPPHPVLIRRPVVTADGRSTRPMVFGPATLDATAGLVVSGAFDGRVRVWDPVTGRVRYAIAVGPATAAPTLATSADARRLAVGSGNGEVTVWQLHPADDAAAAAAARPSDAELLLRLGPEDLGSFGERMAGANRHAVALSPDGTQLLVEREHFAIGVWDVRSGQVQRTLLGHEDGFTELVALADERLAASGGSQGRVRIWDLDTGCCLRTLGPLSASVTSLASSSHDHLLAAADDRGEVRSWVLPALAPLPPATFQVARITTAEEVSAAQRDVDAMVVEADASAGQQDWIGAACAIGRAREIPGFARHPELVGRWRAAIGHLPTGAIGEVWQLRRIHAHADQVHALTLLGPDGPLASGGADGALHLWDPESGSRRASVDHAHDGANVICLANDATGSLIASGGGDGSVRLWDATTLQPIGSWHVHDSGVHGVSFTPDGQQAVAVAARGLAVVHRLDGTRTAQRRLRTRGLYGVSVAPDGSRVAVPTSDGRWYLLDTASLTIGHAFAGHTGQVLCTAISPDGREAASGGQDGTLRRWDLATGRCLDRYEGHGDMVLECTFLRGSDHLASVSWDGTARLWTRGAASPVHTLTASGSRLQTMAVTADGHYFVTGGHDEHVVVWVLDWTLPARMAADRHDRR
jgi:WD40 repeat protein/serine/threonine protein kinase